MSLISSGYLRIDGNTLVRIVDIELNKYISGELQTILASKLNKNQGIENAGKYLKVNNDGMLTVGTVSGIISLSMTISSDSWDESTNPPTATLNNEAFLANSNIVIGTGANLTAEQYAAMRNAQIVCTGQAAGQLTMTAFGKKPTVDLPVSIMIVG